MAIENEIHPIQVNILLALLFKTKARFSELNTLKVPSDQFNFHLKKLIETTLIEKTECNYHLTPKGKEFANRFDTENLVPERQAKVSALVYCTKNIENKTYYLMQERLKEPYYGFIGMISGKVRWGELAEEAAIRELREETGLEGIPHFLGIEHKVDYDIKGELLEDKFFYIFQVKKFKGNLKRRIVGGENKWMTEKEIIVSGKTFDDVYDVFSIIKGRNSKFIEKRYRVKKY